MNQRQCEEIAATWELYNWSMVSPALLYGCYASLIMHGCFQMYTGRLSPLFLPVFTSF